MYFLTYEVIKRKVAESAPKDVPKSKSREMAGTIFAGGMGKSWLFCGFPDEFIAFLHSGYR